MKYRRVIMVSCVAWICSGCLAGELGVNDNNEEPKKDKPMVRIETNNDNPDMGGDDMGGGDDMSEDMSTTDMTSSGLCGGVMCDQNAGCVQDVCRCFGGYRGDGQTCTPLDSCEGVTCGANSTCDKGSCRCDAGYVKVNMECVLDDSNPCDNVTCNTGAICKNGNCECAPGFMGDGQTCTPINPGDTAARTEQQVCDRWKQDRVNQSTKMWQTEPNDQCEPGVLDAVMQEDAIRRTSLFRWLVGLGPVTTKPNYLTITQACATTLAAHNQGLSHSIDMSYTCYSSEAQQGAGSSNLALGRNHPADSVDLYVGDRGVRSLGHRRWVFNPGMGATGFGQRGRYSCMYSFDRGGQGPNPDYVAYPAAGFFPRAALIGYWSFASAKYRFDSNTTVSIKRVSDNQPVTVSDVYIPGGGYGQPTLAWNVATNDVQTGTEYEVTIDNLTGSAGTTVVYRVTLSDCP